MPGNLAIVACSKQKLGARAKAAELYAPSRLFSLSFRQAKADGCTILILSSKYGLVSPEEEIDPYEVDLATLPDVAKRAWEATVGRQLDMYLGGHRPAQVVLFASAAYREPVQRLLRARGVSSTTHPAWRAMCDEAFGRGSPNSGQASQLRS